MRARLAVLEIDPDAPSLDGDIESVRRFMRWAIGRDPKLLTTLDSYGASWNRAAIRNGCRPWERRAYLSHMTGLDREQLDQALAEEPEADGAGGCNDK